MIKKLFLFIILYIGMAPVLKAQSMQPSDTAAVFYTIAEASKSPDKVYKLDLSKRKLTAFPLEIFSFKHLRYLNLSQNRLTLIPSDIEKLQELEILNMGHNKLKEIPNEIGKLKDLRYLLLSQNDIDTVPPEIGDLQKLKVLDLWDNDLGALPETIEKLRNLQILDIRGILFTERQLLRFKELLPEATIYTSPACGTCKDP